MNFQKPSWAESSSIPGTVFDILSEYLQESASNPEGAATLLTAIFDEFLNSAENMKSKIRYLWGTCLWIVKHLPPNDERQDKLITLLLCIRNVSSLSAEESIEEYWGPELWINLPGFRSALGDFEVDAPMVPRLRDRDPYGIYRNREMGPWSQEMSGDEWASISAFVARLHTASPRTETLDVRGLWALLDSLEESRAPEILDDLVPSAACWIIYAGRAIKNNFTDFSDFYNSGDGTKRFPWSVGALYGGPRGFNDERWAFWLMRFREMMLDEKLKPETRRYAERAANEMSEV